MSTSYYRLAEPITHLNGEIGGGHTHLGIWVNHGKTGILVLHNNEVGPFIRLLLSDIVAMRTHWGGSEVGSIVTEVVPGLTDEMQLISEYDEILTVGQIRRRQGSRRQDGYPTELFGYEEQA